MILSRNAIVLEVEEVHPHPLEISLSDNNFSCVIYDTFTKHTLTVEILIVFAIAKSHHLLGMPFCLILNTWAYIMTEDGKGRRLVAANIKCLVSEVVESLQMHCSVSSLKQASSRANFPLFQNQTAPPFNTPMNKTSGLKTLANVL